MLPLALVAAAVVAGSAQANGDPASDILPFSNVFLSIQDPRTSPAGRALLAATHAAAKKKRPIRVAVISQPSGYRKEQPTLSYDGNIKGWGPEITKLRPDVSMDTVDRFLTRMYRNNPDFVYTVTRDFVRSCQTPVLVMPDDSPPHPYAVAMETVMLAPKSEVTIFPWKDPKERVPAHREPP